MRIEWKEEKQDKNGQTTRTPHERRASEQIEIEISRERTNDEESKDVHRTVHTINAH